MEFEFLSEKVEWEAKRVALAFGIEEWERKPEHRLSHTFVGCVDAIKVRWIIEMIEWSTISLQEPGGKYGYQTMCWVSKNPSSHQWVFSIRERQQNLELLARGLYRLGFEDEGVLGQLPTLTAHEKLQLRLSMPRDFWPQRWIDEEKWPFAVAPEDGVLF